ncbi:MAG: hypothetical protein AAF757_04935 [Cyanobacteria bacterium P01_D01_bin.116]
MWNSSKVSTLKNTSGMEQKPMKAKLISAVITTAIFGTIASIANAQTPSIPPANIQMEDGVPSIPGIEFSEEQKEKLKEINQEARSRINEILTSEQQDSLQAAVDGGSDPKEAIKSLNLSTEQRKEFESIQKLKREQLNNILTNEQKTKIMQMRQRKGQGSRFNIRS